MVGILSRRTAWAIGIAAVIAVLVFLVRGAANEGALSGILVIPQFMAVPKPNRVDRMPLSHRLTTSKEVRRSRAYSVDNLEWGTCHVLFIAMPIADQKLVIDKSETVIRAQNATIAGEQTTTLEMHTE